MKWVGYILDPWRNYPVAIGGGPVARYDKTRSPQHMEALVQKYFPQMQPNPVIINEWWSYRYLLAQLPHQNQHHTIPSSAYPEGIPPPTITIPQVDGQPQLIEGMSLEDEQTFVDTRTLL